MVLAGDFNASAEEWGSTRSDSRGDVLREMTSRRGLQLANDGKAPTYRRAGTESFLDLTWFSEGAAERVSTWKVLETETTSDHRYVEFRIEVAGTQGMRMETRANTWGWNPRKLDLEMTRKYIQERIRQGEHAETPEELVGLLQGACTDAARGGPPRRAGARMPKYWWTREIAEKRKQCTKLHRYCYRRRLRPDEAAEADTQYKKAKKELRRLIERSSIWELYSTRG